MLAVCAPSIVHAGHTDPSLDHWIYNRSNGVFSVFEAVRAGDEAVLAERLKEGASANEANAAGDTPLHLAAAAGRASMVLTLLHAGGDPLAKNAAGRTPAELAADAATRKACQQAEAARMRELEMLPLILANRADSLQQALSQGLNPNAESADHTHSLLAVAVRAGAADCARALIQAGASTKYTLPGGKSLLHLAAGAGQAHMIPLLLEAGADPMAQAHNGAFAIHDAIWAGQRTAAIALAPAYRGVHANPNGGANGYPVCMAIQRGFDDVVQALLAAGLNPNDPAFSAEPLLVLAARHNRPQIIKTLLQAGADKEARDATGRRAADYATATTATLLN